MTILANITFCLCLIIMLVVALYDAFFTNEDQ